MGEAARRRLPGEVMSTVLEEVSKPEADLPEAPTIPSRPGEPAWEIARYFPRQGHWTEEAFLAIPNNLRLELNDGVLEFLPVPTFSHHDLLQYLFFKLHGHVTSHKLGLVYVNGVKIKLWDGQIREPDVVYLRPERITDRSKPSDGADLTMEVVSGSHEDRQRDLVVKKLIYAKSGIPEYWIIDPKTESISVLVLKGDAYEVHGEFKSGQVATSVLLPGFEVDVAACFAAAMV
jgi:Uma2 family endonuclease